MRPFFTYYGGKYRAAPRYPAPAHRVIVEPFAGSAGYAMRYPDREVMLVEKSPKIAAVWRWLLEASPADVLALPLWDEGWKTTDDLMHLPDGARFLIALWLNKGSAEPHKSPSRWMRDNIRPNSQWGAAVRQRIADQVPQIAHWRIIEGDYTAAPDVEATWFIDPPYVATGHRYPAGTGLSYEALATWCANRRGQALVCEVAGAGWLPFEPAFTVKATEGAKRSGVVHEVLWRNACPWCRHPAHGAVDSGDGPLCAVGLPDGSDCACPNWGPSDTERAGVQSGVSDGLRDSTNRQVSGNVWED